MKAIDVDFKTMRRPPRWAWTVVAVLAVSAIVAAVGAANEQRRVEELRAELQRLKEEASGRDTPRVVEDVGPPYEASAREMLQEATSPWPSALTALETVKVTGVMLQSVEIAPREREVAVLVQFSDYSALLEYLAQLNAGEPEQKWSLVEARRESGSSAVSSATIRGRLSP